MLMNDVRYALRGVRRAPLYAATVAATIGLGLGLLTSAFTLVNAYVLRTIDLPDPHALVALSWDTSTVRRHQFSLSDFESARDTTPHFTGLAAGRTAIVMQDSAAVNGLLVSDNYFTLLGARAALGRTLQPGDATALVVLSERVWRTSYGADPSIVGRTIMLGRQRVEVVGVMPPGAGLTGEELVAFWAPLASAAAFGVADPRSEPDTPSLTVVGRLRQHGTAPQVRAWLQLWLEQRYPRGSPHAPTSVAVESRATRLPITRATLTMLTVILTAFGLVLLVACANVTNLMLARALTRQRELAVRLSLGASRWRVVRQLIVESLVLAVPASAVGLALTIVAARVFPALVLGTFPDGIGPIDGVLQPLDPDARVMAVLLVAAVLSSVLVSVAPAVRAARTDLARASRGEAAWDPRRSRLRTALVAVQIGACVLFLVGATGLVDETRRLANPDTGLSYERVADVQVSPRLRAAVARRLESNPAVEYVVAAWQPPLNGPPRRLGVVASDTGINRSVGFMVVSPQYFPAFDIRLIAGRNFTAIEADEDAPVALVSAATAQALWPGLDPIGRTLNLPPVDAPVRGRRPRHTSVRIIGVAEDVSTGTLLDGLDLTCVYFTTGLRAPGEMSLLVRGRTDNLASLKASVAAAVNAVELDAPFRFFALRQMMGGISWVFGAISAAASLLGAVGLLLAFSGTFAVVSFLVAQRTREFGIRLALGATVPTIVSGMLGETLRTAAFGVAGGLAVAAGLIRALDAVAEVVPPYGPRAYVIGTTIVLVSTLLAALLPSLRTARIDPSAALRVE